jgi:putative addiction module killer protein
MIEIRHYTSANGKDVFETWLAALRSDQIEARIDARINRLAGGNFGDCKAVGERVWELRIDFGPGYRVYYSMIGKTCGVRDTLGGLLLPSPVRRGRVGEGVLL